MHADQLANLARRHDGVIPPSWLSGDTHYQKAAVIAAVAWHDIKSPSDPELPACDLTHRENCIGVVESLLRGSLPDDSPFARAAARRLAELNQPPTEELTQ